MPRSSRYASRRPQHVNLDDSNREMVWKDDHETDHETGDTETGEDSEDGLIILDDRPRPRAAARRRRSTSHGCRWLRCCCCLVSTILCTLVVLGSSTAEGDSPAWPEISGTRVKQDVLDVLHAARNSDATQRLAQTVREAQESLRQRTRPSTQPSTTAARRKRGPPPSPKPSASPPPPSVYLPPPSAAPPPTLSPFISSRVPQTPLWALQLVRPAQPPSPSSILPQHDLVHHRPDKARPPHSAMHTAHLLPAAVHGLPPSPPPSPHPPPVAFHVAFSADLLEDDGTAFLPQLRPPYPPPCPPPCPPPYPSRTASRMQLPPRHDGTAAAGGRGHDAGDVHGGEHSNTHGGEHGGVRSGAGAITSLAGGSFRLREVDQAVTTLPPPPLLPPTPNPGPGLGPGPTQLDQIDRPHLPVVETSMIDRPHLPVVETSMMPATMMTLDGTPADLPPHPSNDELQDATPPDPRRPIPNPNPSNGGVQDATPSEPSALALLWAGLEPSTALQEDSTNERPSTLPSAPVHPPETYTDVPGAYVPVALEEPPGMMLQLPPGMMAAMTAAGAAVSASAAAPPQSGADMMAAAAMIAAAAGTASAAASAAASSAAAASPPINGQEDEAVKEAPAGASSLKGGQRDDEGVGRAGVGGREEVLEEASTFTPAHPTAEVTAASDAQSSASHSSIVRTCLSAMPNDAPHAQVCHIDSPIASILLPIRPIYIPPEGPAAAHVLLHAAHTARHPMFDRHV